MRHGLAAHGVEQRRDVARVVGAGIDDGDTPAPDDIAHRALERERARIVGEQPAHAGRDFLNLAGLEIERAIERNVVCHARAPARRAAAYTGARADATPREAMER
jgi:hypothetical protein